MNSLPDHVAKQIDTVTRDPKTSRYYVRFIKPSSSLKRTLAKIEKMGF